MGMKDFLESMVECFFQTTLIELPVYADLDLTSDDNICDIILSCGGNG